MSAIENFILRFKVEGAKALQGLKDDLKDLADNANPLAGSLGNLTGKLGLMGTGALAAAGAFAALGMRAINIADELQDMADATGIGADQLLNLKQSIVEAGGKADSFVQVASKLNVAIGEAMGGNEKYQKSFQSLGVFVTDASGKVRDSGDIMQDVIGKLAGIEDPSIRAAKAVELLGKEASKIDWSKVSAGRDAITKEQIEQLAKYRGEIDKFNNSVENKLVTSFGSLAKTMNQFFKEYDSQGFDAFLSRLQVASLRLSGFNKEANQLRSQFNDKVSADAQAKAETDAETNRLARRTLPGSSTAVGGYGGMSEATLKAQADSALRTQKSYNESRKQAELAAANDIQKIEIAAQYEAQSARAEILAKGKEAGLNFSKEAAAKEAEIYAKRDTDIAQARRQLNVKIASEEIAQAEQTAKEMAAYYQEVDQARLAAFDQVKNIRDQTAELQGRFDLQQKIVGLSTLDQQRATELFELEKQRKQQLDQIAKNSRLPYNERLEEEKKINAEFEKRIELINKEADVRAKREASFSAGIEESMKKYAESMTPLKQGAAMADSVYSNMGSALDRFVDTGKFKFSDFASSVISDLLKIQLRAAATQLFNSVLGTFGFSLPGRAAGGPVTAGQPYIVGEQGPEVFLPTSSGTIVPNNKIGGQAGGNQTNISYNIQAVDALSFRQLVAKDPSFIYAVTEQGRKSIPVTRR